MKTKIILIILLLGKSAATVFSGVLYSNNFEPGFPGYGWVKTASLGTTNDSPFYSGLVISGSIQSSAGNHYDETAMTVPTLPSSPLTRWYGGASLSLIPSAQVPNNWSLSFDVRESSGDPLQVRLYLNNGAQIVPEYVGWVTPSSGDWSHVTIQSDQLQFILGTDFDTGTTASLYILMASHDANSNPLALSNIGTQQLDIDNLVLASIPEPSSVLLLSFGALAMFWVRHRTCPATA